MSDGWCCTNCAEFFLDVILQTKITVSIEPREYAAEATFCSLRCFDDYRSHLDDHVAWAQEHDTSNPKWRQRVIEEEVEAE
jgi:hypothetical protein